MPYQILQPFIIVMLPWVFSTLPATAENAGDTLHVGFIGGFSGPAQVYGLPCRNGFELGREGFTGSFRVTYEDDQFLAAKTVTAFQKLTQIDKVELVIVLGSVNAHAIESLAEKNDILLFAWAGDQTVARDKPHVVQTWVSGQESGARLAQELRSRGLDEVGLVRVEDDHPRSVWDGLKSVYDGRVSLDTVVPPNEVDFRAIVLNAKGRGLKHVGLCVGPGQAALFAKQARAQKASFSFFGCETLDNDTEVRGVPELDGAWLTSVGATAQFREKYIARYGNDSMVGAAAVHHHLAHILSRMASQPLTSRGAGELRSRVLALGAIDDALGAVAVNCADSRCRLEVPLVVKSVRDGKISPIVERSLE